MLLVARLLGVTDDCRLEDKELFCKQPALISHPLNKSHKFNNCRKTDQPICYMMDSL